MELSRSKFVFKTNENKDKDSYTSKASIINRPLRECTQRLYSVHSEIMESWCSLISPMAESKWEVRLVVGPRRNFGSNKEDPTEFGLVEFERTLTLGGRRILTLDRTDQDDSDSSKDSYFAWLRDQADEFISIHNMDDRQPNGYPTDLALMLCVHTESTVVRTSKQLLSRRGVVQSLLASVACSKDVCEIFVDGRNKLFAGRPAEYPLMRELLKSLKVDCSSQEIAELLNGSKADLLEPFVKVYLCAEKKRPLSTSMDFFRRAEKIAERERFVFTAYGLPLEQWKNLQATETFTRELGYRREPGKPKDKTQNKSGNAVSAAAAPFTEGLNLPRAGNKGNSNSSSSSGAAAINAAEPVSQKTVVSAQQIGEVLDSMSSLDPNIQAFLKNLLEEKVSADKKPSGGDPSEEEGKKIKEQKKRLEERERKRLEKKKKEEGSKLEWNFDYSSDMGAFPTSAELDIKDKLVLRQKASGDTKIVTFVFNFLDGEILPAPNGAYKATILGSKIILRSNLPDVQ